LPNSLFISHRAPDLVLADTQVSRSIEAYGARMHRLDGIVMVSAHHQTAIPPVVSNL